jgi:hypothetical protein
MDESNNFDELKNRLFEIARETTDSFKHQWDAQKDIAKTLISLASGALVFTVTFATSVIKLTHGKRLSVMTRSLDGVLRDLWFPMESLCSSSSSLGFTKFSHDVRTA